MTDQRKSKNGSSKISLLRLQQGKPLAKVAPRVAALDPRERLKIIDAWILVLQDIYPHLSLKQALYGFDPIRAMEHLRRQASSLSDIQFHREITILVSHLRDAHTWYSGPKSIRGAVANLPFLVEAWGEASHCHYVVSKVTDPRIISHLIKDPHFKPGVTLKSWNGIPFERAVELHAENETGGRPDAQIARALESLTYRSLEYGPPPDEQWVDISYVDLHKKEREVRFPWKVVFPKPAPTSGQHQGAMRLNRGIDSAAEAVRRAKKLMFKGKLWAEERSGTQIRKAGKGWTQKFKDLLSAREVPGGKFGYLRIWSFNTDDDQEFIEAAIEILESLPKRGLIIDLRDNPGGLIPAAERMLQLFTPNRIEPTKFALRATDMTKALAAARSNRPDLGAWAESLATALSTGQTYSRDFPITPVERCNDIGQRYPGPVVVVVNANTYSCGDLFTAGIADNQIGKVVCIGEATGAGGANVWSSKDVSAAMKAAHLPLPALAHGVNFSIAFRRAVRGGSADGTLIEDAGITGQPYAMTKRDLFSDNKDLIAHCANILSHQPWTQLDVVRKGRTLTITTAGLDQLDIYSEGHPAVPGIPIERNGTTTVQLPANARSVEVVGYSQTVIRQRRRLLTASNLARHGHS